MRKRFKWQLGLVLVIGVGLLIATLGSVVGRGLRTEVITSNADIGISGVTRMYSARVTNDGFLPVRIASCNFVDDTLSRGTMLAYSVQRRNNDKATWDTIAEFGKAEFCKPYPLGIVKASLAKRWLWPGQSLSTSEEATAARGGFAIGDSARFVVFLGDAGDYSSSVASREFRIDQHPDLNPNLRVTH